LPGAENYAISAIKTEDSNKKPGHHRLYKDNILLLEPRLQGYILL
jgi:hypothetical protein